MFIIYHTLITHVPHPKMLQLSFIIILIQGLRYNHCSSHNATCLDINSMLIHLSLREYKITLGESYLVTLSRIV